MSYHAKAQSANDTHLTRSKAACLLLVGATAALSGCSTMKDGGKWGRDALYPIQWKRIPQAALHAVIDPATWVPAMGATVFSIDNFDRKVSRWASQNTPIFGSQATAGDVSDYARTALVVESYATVALTPSGDEPADWFLAKAKGLSVETAAHLANGSVTGLGKNWIGRERPDGSSDQSMPSGHATIAFGSARLANRNLDAIDLQRWARRTCQAGNFVAAGATAWARVEAERHYPSDVLVGAALGNFITTFVHDALMNLPEDAPDRVRVEASGRSFLLFFNWQF